PEANSGIRSVAQRPQRRKSESKNTRAAGSAESRQCRRCRTGRRRCERNAYSPRPGYRVYFRQQGETATLLWGGDKDSQTADIKTAKELAQESKDWRLWPKHPALMRQIIWIVRRRLRITSAKLSKPAMTKSSRRRSARSRACRECPASRATPASRGRIFIELSAPM